MLFLNLTDMTVISYHELDAETVPSTGFEIISPAGEPVQPGDLMIAGQYPAHSSGKKVYVTHIEDNLWSDFWRDSHLYIISLTYTAPDSRTQDGILCAARRFYRLTLNELRYVYGLSHYMMAGD